MRSRRIINRTDNDHGTVKRTRLGLVKLKCYLIFFFSNDSTCVRLLRFVLLPYILLRSVIIRDFITVLVSRVFVVHSVNKVTEGEQFNRLTILPSKCVSARAHVCV